MPAPEQVAPEPASRSRLQQAAAWSVAARITLAAAISVLLSTTAGRGCFRYVGARRRSPRSTTQVRNRGALAPGLMRIG
jgi:hypothetical protein